MAFLNSSLSRNYLAGCTQNCCCSKFATLLFLWIRDNDSPFVLVCINSWHDLEEQDVAVESYDFPLAVFFLLVRWTIIHTVTDVFFLYDCWGIVLLLFCPNWRLAPPQWCNQLARETGCDDWWECEREKKRQRAKQNGAKAPHDESVAFLVTPREDHDFTLIPVSHSQGKIRPRPVVNLHLEGPWFMSQNWSTTIFQNTGISVKDHIACKLV